MRVLLPLHLFSRKFFFLSPCLYCVLHIASKYTLFPILQQQHQAHCNKLAWQRFGRNRKHTSRTSRVKARKKTKLAKFLSSAPNQTQWEGKARAVCKGKNGFILVKAFDASATQWGERASTGEQATFLSLSLSLCLCACDVVMSQARRTIAFALCVSESCSRKRNNIIREPLLLLLLLLLLLSSLLMLR